MSATAIELEQARTLVASRVTPLPAVVVSLESALGRVLAREVRAAEDVPAFDSAAMDGYAVRASDTGAGARLRVVGEARAGSPATVRVGPGEACEISTGAMVPPGADTVVRVEETRATADWVELAAAVAADRDIRHAGEDVRAGAVALAPGARLGPAHLAVAASLGATSVAVGARPRVAVVTTGDELVPAGGPLPVASVRDSGAYLIAALVSQAGGETTSVACARDDPDAITAAIERALDAADAIVVTGGMSVGRHDHVGRSMRAAGVETHFDGVAIRPGKPTSFGTRGATLAFGLPGNPLSSLVAFVLVARPALLALAGDDPERLRAFAALGRDVARAPHRTRIIRCKLEWRDDGLVAGVGPPGPHMLGAIVDADGLAVIPAGEGIAAAGTRVLVERIDR